MKKEIRIKVHEKHNGCCAYCGNPLNYKDMQVDHITAKHIGGIDEIENYNPACRSCNFRKSTFSIEAFREEIEKQTERLHRDSSQYRLAKRFGLIAETKKPVVFYFEKQANRRQLK